MIKPMRCKNCGWPNKPNEIACVKCGSPLEVESAMSDYGNDSRYSNDGDGLKKTVMESEAFGSQLDNMPYGPVLVEPTQTIREITCPKCGYPMREDVSKCPNCNFQVGENNDAIPSNVRTNGYSRRPTRMTDTADVESEQEPRIIPKVGKLRGTINPYMMEVPQDPTFVLKPLQRMNERKPAEPVEIELENGAVVLTRDNTEQGNLSITSKEQAVVCHSDGHWYIENCSEQKTTFVLASHKIEIQDGDIILLGNRMFEFKEQK